MKKAIKTAGIIGGFVALTEIFGTIGEVQAFYSMHLVNKDATDEMLDLLKEPEKCGVKGYKAMKCKAIRWLTLKFIELDE